MPETHIDPKVWKRSEKVVNIELIRDGDLFIVRATYAKGKVQEFKNRNFEDLWTEFVKAASDEVDDD